MTRLDPHTIGRIARNAYPVDVADGTKIELAAALLQMAGVDHDPEEMAGSDRVPVGALRAAVLGMYAELHADALSDVERRSLQREAARMAPGGSRGDRFADDDDAAAEATRIDN
jgi:hypothetical protein